MLIVKEVNILRLQIFFIFEVSVVMFTMLGNATVTLLGDKRTVRKLQN